MNPKAKSVDATLDEIARASESVHPTRQLARDRIAQYRQGTAIDPLYDFSTQPEQLRQIVYNAAVRWHYKRRWRLFG